MRKRFGVEHYLAENCIWRKL